LEDLESRWQLLFRINVEGQRRLEARGRHNFNAPVLADVRRSLHKRFDVSDRVEELILARVEFGHGQHDFCNFIGDIFLLNDTISQSLLQHSLLLRVHALFKKCFWRSDLAAGAPSLIVPGAAGPAGNLLGLAGADGWRLLPSVLGWLGADLLLLGLLLWRFARLNLDDFALLYHLFTLPLHNFTG